MTWSPRVPRDFAGEAAKIRWEVIQYVQGEGLDLGCGPWKIMRHATGMDEGSGAAPFLTGDIRNLARLAGGAQDFVFSSHALEDIEDTNAALAEWWRVLKPGGHLVLYLPHADLYPRRGRPGANPAHKHDFMPQDIVGAMARVAPDWELVENQTRGEADEYSFLQVYRKTEPGAGQRQPAPVQAERRCIVMRFGGFGDMLISSSTFPWLKAEGWHLTVYTGDKGAEVLENDPYVDRIAVMDMTALSNGELRDLCGYLAGRCAKFVNFSEVFEGLLLANPQRPNFWWPQAMRRHYMNGSYLEAAHRVAGAPVGPAEVWRQKFYPSEPERVSARAWRDEHPGRLVLVAATGSGVNKIWPGLFEYAGRLVKRHPGLQVAVVGGLYGAQLLEHPRLHAIGETWPVRRSLALALEADLVLGQETGILNAVAFEAMPKIVLLSHSSPENLTSHWRNTSTLAGDVPCYPCHRLHGDWRGCNRDPQTSFSACQSAIAPMTAIGLTEQLLGLGAAVIPIERLGWRVEDRAAARAA